MANFRPKLLDDILARRGHRSSLTTVQSPDGVWRPKPLWAIVGEAKPAEELLLADSLNKLEGGGQTTTGVWPTDYGKITESFGQQKDRFHSGLDIRNPMGSPAYAYDEGTIIRVFHNEQGGNQILIQHPDGSVTGYAHTQPTVKPGQKVSRGQVIGHSDGSGHVTAPHLHFTWRPCLTCERKDPLPHLPPAPEGK